MEWAEWEMIKDLRIYTSQFVTVGLWRQRERTHVLPRLNLLRAAKKKQKQTSKRQNFPRIPSWFSREVKETCPWRGRTWWCRVQKESFQSHVWIWFLLFANIAARHDERKQKREKTTQTHNKDKHSNNRNRFQKSLVLWLKSWNTSFFNQASVSAENRPRREFITGTAGFNSALKGSTDTWRCSEMFPLWPFSTSTTGTSSCRLQAAEQQDHRTNKRRREK